VLHGGPGAPGSAAPIAQGLADRFRVLEPWQRGAGESPLTVARHIADLSRVLENHCPGERPALVGESWGAMLALAFAAEFPQRVAALALVGCGTFDDASRARMHEILAERIDPDLRRRVKGIPAKITNPDERLREQYRLVQPLYFWDPIDPAPGLFNHFDAQAHRETWDDLLRLQESGRYPAAFSAIGCPASMFHGDYDPHPGRMIREGLRPSIPHLEYREFQHCGHFLWNEREAAGEFFSALRGWLEKQAADGGLREF
jgi:pimeloyl-ACP methyl ester carboxylesterase